MPKNDGVHTHVNTGYQHSLANRHTCSTSAETSDRMCFSMKLILVVDNMDMINATCYHFVESYCQFILLKKYY